jgi:hypothetical protein
MLDSCIHDYITESHSDHISLSLFAIIIEIIVIVLLLLMLLLLYLGRTFYLSTDSVYVNFVGYNLKVLTHYYVHNLSLQIIFYT